MSAVSDPFMKLLEQMARALGEALNKLTGLKQYANNENGFEFIAKFLQTDFDIELNKLILLKEDLIIEYLTKKSFHNSHMEKLSEILFELAEINTEEKDKKNL